jgi:hypothetical protein
MNQKFIIGSAAMRLAAGPSIARRAYEESAQPNEARLLRFGPFQGCDRGALQKDIERVRGRNPPIPHQARLKLRVQGGA